MEAGEKRRRKRRRRVGYLVHHQEVIDLLSVRTADVSDLPHR